MRPAGLLGQPHLRGWVHKPISRGAGRRMPVVHSRGTSVDASAGRAPSLQGMTRFAQLSEVGRQQGGVVAAWQARLLGVGQSWLDRQVDGRGWARVHTGVFRMAGVADSTRTVCWASLLVVAEKRAAGAAEALLAEGVDPVAAVTRAARSVGQFSGLTGAWLLGAVSRPPHARSSSCPPTSRSCPTVGCGLCGPSTTQGRGAWWAGCPWPRSPGCSGTSRGSCAGGRTSRRRSATSRSTSIGPAGWRWRSWSDWWRTRPRSTSRRVHRGHCGGRPGCSGPASHTPARRGSPGRS